MYQPDAVPEVTSSELPAGAYLLDVREDGAEPYVA